MNVGPDQLMTSWHLSLASCTVAAELYAQAAVEIRVSGDDVMRRRLAGHEERIESRADWTECKKRLSRLRLVMAWHNSRVKAKISHALLDPSRVGPHGVDELYETAMEEIAQCSDEEMKDKLVENVGPLPDSGCASCVHRYRMRTVVVWHNLQVEAHEH